VNEHSFIKAVHRSLPTEIYRWKIHDTYTGGVPDVFYAGPAGMLFIEYKYVKELPKRKNTAIKNKLSGLQKAWLTQMESFGHAVAAVIGIKQDVLILDSSDIWSTDIPFDFYNANKITRPQYLEWVARQTLHEGNNQPNSSRKSTKDLGTQEKRNAD
jgi:hypothetical protein